MKLSISEILSKGTPQKLLIELILALENIGLDYSDIVETYRETIKKPLEESTVSEDQETMKARKRN